MIDPKNETNVILKNFQSEDYQFRGQILNGGYQIHVSEADHNLQEFLLIETRLSDILIKRVSKEDKKDEVLDFTDEEQATKKKYDKSILLSFHERNLIFEKQLKVLLNIVPFDI